MANVTWDPRGDVQAEHLPSRLGMSGLHEGRHASVDCQGVVDVSFGIAMGDWLNFDELRPML